MKPTSLEARQDFQTHLHLQTCARARTCLNDQPGGPTLCVALVCVDFARRLGVGAPS